MGLTSLNTALSGLAIAQQQISLISNNVSNVGTEGFTRKILPQSTQAVEGKSIGVRAGIITRNVNLNLSESLWTQVSSVASGEVKASYLNRISQFHGPPDQEISISAELSQLQDSFAVLSDDPTDAFLLAQTVDQAVDMAEKINDFSSLISNLRNEAQNEISSSVTQINGLLEQIADLNDQIRSNLNLGRSTAAAEDVRDQSIKELSELIEISFFKRGDGVIVVQTAEGAELAGTDVNLLTFRGTPLAPTTFYPDSAAGLFIGDPATDPVTFEITDREIGGKLGGLLELRDEIFPKQSAQLDELAHKLATRFEAQGLRLFTDETGTVPLNTAPDLSVDPQIAVPYVGFADSIRVNASIINDNTILQTGTTGATVPVGSNELISRILDFTFGATSFQQATGAVDLTVSLNAPPNERLQTFLGLISTNAVAGTRDLEPFADPATFITATNTAISPTTGAFRVAFEEPSLGLGPINIDIDLNAVADGAGNFNQDIIDHINGVVIPALTPAEQADLLSLNAQITIGTNGELSFTSNGNITIDATNPVNAMGASNLEFLGLAEGTTEAEDPYFDIAVGNSDSVRIFIEPNENETTFLAKLQAVPGLAAQYGVGGNLELRPGNDFTSPDFGGELKIVSGPFSVDSAGANAVFGAGTIPDGINVISAVLGSFIAGPPAQDSSPVTNVGYQSVVSDTDLTGIAFREDFLGPGANISTGIRGSTSLLDYAQRIVNENAQELIIIEETIADDNTFRDLLEDQILSESGVNLDEELANLIVVQTAYAASARVVNVVDEMFQELLNAV